MKRKLMTLLLAAVMAAALALPACADIMWEPYGNAFYESHRDETDYENRGYLINGAEGYATVYAAPDSLVEVVNFPNGTDFNVGMTWTAGDGTQWAVGYHMEQTEDGWEDYTGWVPLSDLALIYDYNAFEEDHGYEFAEYDGSGNDLTAVCLYSYPGGTYSHTLEESEDYMPFDEAFTHLYTDGEGRRWSYIGYYMGRRNAWACLDDPLNEKLGTDGYRTVAQVRAGEEPIPAVDGADAIPAAKTWVMWAVPAALVVAVAVVTAVLVRKKRNK